MRDCWGDREREAENKQEEEAKGGKPCEAVLATLAVSLQAMLGACTSPLQQVSEEQSTFSGHDMEHKSYIMLHANVIRFLRL